MTTESTSKLSFCDSLFLNLSLRHLSNRYGDLSNSPILSWNQKAMSGRCPSEISRQIPLWLYTLHSGKTTWHSSYVLIFIALLIYLSGAVPSILAFRVSHFNVEQATAWLASSIADKSSRDGKEGGLCLPMIIRRFVRCPPFLSFRANAERYLQPSRNVSLEGNVPTNSLATVISLFNSLCQSHQKYQTHYFDSSDHHLQHGSH